LNISCDGSTQQSEIDAWLANNGGATASDLCSDETITWTYQYEASEIDDCGGTGSTTVTFTTMDNCGRTASTTASINVSDAAAPTITVDPLDAMVECDGAGNAAEFQTWLDTQGGADASDECGEVTWSNDYEPLTDECAATGMTTVTFIATDECNNSSTVQAVFKIEDTTAPTIDTPAEDIIVQCDGVSQESVIQDWLNTNGGATGSDACGQTVWSNDYDPTEVSDGCSGSGSRTVTFTIIDECGLMNSTSASLTIEDNTAPIITNQPTDLTVECDGLGNIAELEAWAESNTGVDAEDECGTITWSYEVGDLTPACGLTGTAIVVLIATDDCGNSSTTTANFTIEDNTPPSIVQAPEDLTIDCDGAGNTAEIQAWLDAQGNAVGDDDCGNVSWENDFENTFGPCAASENIVVTFTATDECGNSSIATATVFKIDDLAPFCNPIASAGPDQDICEGGEVTLMAEVEEGTGPYIFDWDNGLGLGQTHTLNIYNTTTFTVTITDNNGCVNTDEIVVTVDPALNPTADAGSGLITCAGVNVVLGGSPTGIPSAIDGSPIVDYAWSPLAGLDDPNSPNPTANVNTNTTYTVTVTSESGCTGTAVAEVIVEECASIGNFVWLDKNGNGIQDPTEQPVSDVIVTLFDGAGNQVDQMTTGPDGMYLFEDLYAGDYYVEMTLPGFLMVFTEPNQGGDSTLDSDFDPATGQSPVVSLAPGDSNQDLDAGIYQPVNIGNQIFIDEPGGSNEYAFDSGDTAFPGVTVNLYNANTNTVVGTMVSDANGNYLFESYPPGDYYLEFIAPAGYTAVPVNYDPDDTIDSDIDPATGISHIIMVCSGELDLTVDAGYYTPIDLELEKLVDNSTPLVGGTVTFTISVTNPSFFDGTNVEVTDYVPSGYSNITNISDDGILNGGEIVWSDMTIPAGGQVDLTFEATVNATGEYLNIAEITDQYELDDDSTPDNDDGDQSEDDEDNEIIVPISQIDLELVKTVDDLTPNIGQVVTFTIVVSNTGLSDATGIEITDYVPSGYGAISDIDNGGSASGANVTWSGIDLAVGESITLTFGAEVLASGVYLNTAEVTSANEEDIDSTPGNDDGDQSEDDEDNAEVTPCEIEMTADIVDVLCFSDLTGEIVVTLTNAVDPVQYTWSTGATTKDLDNLSAGDYTLDIVDANGCVAQEIFSVSQPAEALTLSSDFTNTSCGFENGTASVTPQGGEAPYSFDWSTGESTAEIENLIPGFYNVVVTDSNGCSAVSDITIDISDAPLVNVDGEDTSCGEENGVATAYPAAGISPYTYLWSTGDTSESITDLGVGTYTLLVTDAVGCTANGTVEIFGSELPTCSVIGTDTGCGEENGTATVSATGGVAPYTFEWINGETTETISDLAQGTYTVTVTDAAGCENNCELTIAGSELPTCSVIGTDTGCGEENGTATVSATDGVAPYTFEWINGETTETISDLAQGTYTVTVTDAEGCENSCEVTIAGSELPTCSVIGTDTGCGEENGTATVSATGGVAPYTFEWINGETTETISDLAQGTYTVTVTDAEGCENSCELTIAGSELPTCTVIGTDTGCGEENGTATVSATGGVAPYTFEWINGETTETVSDLAQGTYTVTVTDAEGCENSCEVTIAGSELPTCSIVGLDTGCGEENGEATVSAAGGVAPYTFEWFNGETTETISNLAEGTYSVTVTDAEGCENNCSVTIGGSENPVSSVTTTDTGCGESNGQATVAVTGGVSPYSYAWSNGTNGQQALALAEGTYGVTVTDAEGCTSSNTFSILGSELPSCIIESTDTGCGENNGTATVTATGGVAPYTYAWGHGPTTASVTDLPEGNYAVVVTDSEGCETSCNVTINGSELPSCSIEGTATECGEANGSATVTATGGVAPYTFLWSNNETTETISGLSEGSYTAIVTDAAGCTSICEVEILGSSTPSCSVEGTDTTCGENNGTAVVTVTGGTAPYYYVWTSGHDSDVVTDLEPGSYTIIVTDSKGCQTTCYIEITSSNLPVCTATSTNTSCGEANGTATATLNGGVSPYSYAWSNGGTSETITDLVEGSYTVTITDGIGCESICTVEVLGSDIPTCSVEGSDTGCGENNGSAIASAVGGIAPYTFNWSTGDSGETVNDLPEGTYQVTVTDNEGCTNTCEVAILGSELPVCTIDGTDTGCGENNGTATASSTGGFAPYTYAWSHGPTTSVVTDLAEGTYQVIVTDAAGCSSTCDVIITGSELPTCTVSGTDTDCGEDNGSATVTAIGGVAPYTYLWSNNETSGTASALAAGVYTVTVADAEGCMNTCEVTINASELPVCTILGTDTSCGVENGEAIATATGGIAPYTYAWSNGGSTDQIQNLAVGNYILTVTDAAGCSSTCSVDINASSNPSCSITGTDVTCASTDGTLDLTVVDGVAPYTFAWSNGASTEDLTDLAAGSYSVVVTDAAGCTTTCDFVINQIACIIDLDLVKSVNDNNPLVGTAVVFTITVSNTGGDDATGVAVEDLVPSGYSSITNISNNGSLAANKVTWSNLSLTAGQSINLTFEATVEFDGEHENTAQVTAADQEDIDSTPNNDDGDQSEDDEDNATIEPLALGSIGNYVWLDENGDGIQDMGEMPMENITMNLLDASGAVIATTTTDAMGQYIFIDLVPGDYSVQVDPGFLHVVSPMDRGNDTMDSDFDPNTNTSAPITLGANENNMTLDVGLFIPATIGNQVWIDIPGDPSNVFGSGDLPVDGLTVNLYDANTNQVVQSVQTGNNGSYLFSNLVPGSYFVEFIIPSGYSFVTPNIGNDDAIDSDADQITGRTHVVDLLSGGLDLTLDAGVITPIDLSLDKRVDNPTPIVGQTIQYTIDITNTGTFVATGVDVVDYLPSGFSNPTNISDGGVANADGSIEWTDLSVLAGATITLTFECTVEASGLYLNIAEVTGADQADVDSEIDNDDGDQSEDDEDNVIINPINEVDLELVKSVSNETPNAGDQITFTIAVSNSSQVNATGVSVADYLPTGYSGVTNISDSGFNSGSTISWSALTIPAGGSVTLTFDATVNPSGVYLNTAEITASDMPDIDSTPGNDDGDQSEDDEDNATTQVCQLELTSELSDALCSGDTSGAINITVTNAVAPISYTWSNGASTEDLTNVTSGTYTVDIEDGNGCVTSESFTINEPSGMTCSIDSGDASCGLENGAAQVFVTGGVEPYDFNWSHGQNSEFATNLPAGTYTVVVTDANGCQTSCETTIATSQVPTCSASAVDATCGDANGSATVFAQGGTSGYSYLWSNGETTATASNLAGGGYTVTITDAMGCQTTCDVNVGNADNPITTVSSIPTTCGEQNGTAEVFVTGGVQPYTYSWSNGDNNKEAINIAAGVYIITVTDANGCRSTSEVTVDSSEVPTCQFDKEDTSCGETNGSITAIPNGGQPPYSFQWSNGATSATNNNLSAGDYLVTVVDNLGCETYETVSITSSDMPTSTVTHTNAVCGEDNGTATVAATGGTGAYTYAWSNGASGQSITGLIAGNYVVSVTDNMGCLTTSSVDISSSGLPEATATATNTQCGQSDGTAIVAVTSGLAPYNYAWSNGQTTESISGLIAGVYQVIVTDANGCSATSEIAVSNSTGPQVTVNGTDATCGTANGQATAAATGGTAPYFFEWSNNDIGSTASNLMDGDYIVTVTDGAGCENTGIISIGLSGAPTLFTSSVETKCGVENGSATATVSGGVSPYAYQWSNGETTAVITNIGAGNYFVTITDATGCDIVDMAVVANSQAVTASVTTVDAGCGTATGSAIANGQGGQGPYTYNWSTGASGNNVNNLAVGTHVVSVTDATGCQVVEQVVIAEQACLVDLALAKIVDNPTQIVGGIVTFTISVSNSGPNDATGVSIADHLPAGYLYPQNISNGGTYTNGDIVWTNLSIANGSIINLTFDVTVSPVDDYVNTAEVMAIDQMDIDSAPNNDNGDQSEDDEARAGLTPTELSSIGNLVWADDDGDGIQDQEESGFAGVTVQLLDEMGAVIKTTTTDANGNYLFDDLFAGNYYVKVLPPLVHEIAPAHIGAMSDMDSDIDQMTGTTPLITLGAEEHRTDIDAGVYLPARIGNIVWIDVPGGRNNEYDGGDQGLAGVTVTLWDMDSNSIVKTTSTDNNGSYLFEVPAGTYAVQFSSNSNYVLVVPSLVADDKDSDADPISGFTHTFNVTPGEVNLTIDAGYSITVPLEWVEFWGENRGEFNYLEWTVANEVNVSHYEVERALGQASEFEYIGSVISQEIEFVELSYDFDDYDITENTTYYYRIKQIDKDGYSSYSDIIAIKINPELAEELKQLVVYPNPITAGELLLVNITTDKVEELTGEIYDMKGALIRTLDLGMSNVGLKNVEVDVTDFPAGAYILRIQIGNEAFIEKLTKLD